MILRFATLAPLLGTLTLLACSSPTEPALGSGGAGGTKTTGGQSGTGGTGPGTAGVNTAGSAESQAGAGGSDSVVDAAAAEIPDAKPEGGSGFPIGDPGTMGDGDITVMPP